MSIQIIIQALKAFFVQFNVCGWTTQWFQLISVFYILENFFFSSVLKADFREDGKLNSFVFVVANDWERCIKDEAESYVKIVAYFKEVVASLQSELAEVSE